MSVNESQNRLQNESVAQSSYSLSESVSEVRRDERTPTSAQEFGSMLRS